MPTRPLALAVLLVAWAVPPAAAQGAPPDTTVLPPNTEPYEVGVLRSVYGADAEPFVVAMRGVNASAYPVFLGAAPALWSGALLTGTDTRPALRLTLAEAGAVGLTFALKNLIRRPRPYAALPGVRARERSHQGDDVFDPHSFPSGHTSTAFSIATSLSLSYPEWYVIAPAAAWAGGMGLTRVWHGVHYPSDVLAGAALGVGAAVLVQVLVPTSDDVECGACAVAPVAFVIPL